MKRSEECPKCSGTEIESMNLSTNVFLDFGTYYLGDIVVPKLYICLECGYSESWIDSEKDLADIRKFAEVRRAIQGSSPDP